MIKSNMGRKVYVSNSSIYKRPSSKAVKAGSQGGRSLEGGGKTNSIQKGPVELERTAAVQMPQGSSSELAGPSLVAVRQLQAEKLQNRAYVWDWQCWRVVRLRPVHLHCAPVGRDA